MEEYDFKKEEVRMNILTNRHNHITTCYYLLLKNKIKRGLFSVSDLISEDFRKYISDNRNLLSNYEYEINLVVQDRSISPKRKGLFSIPNKLEENNNSGNKMNAIEDKKLTDLNSVNSNPYNLPSKNFFFYFLL